MNLVPIDSGSIAPAADVPPDATGGSVEFASIMTGLLAGDSQIAPVIDLPTTPAEAEPEFEGDLDQSSSLLQLVGSPPAELTLLHPVADRDPEAPDGSTKRGAIAGLHVVPEVASVPQAAAAISDLSAVSTLEPAPGPTTAQVVGAEQNATTEVDTVTTLAQSIAVSPEHSSTKAIAPEPVITPDAGSSIDARSSATTAPATSVTSSTATSSRAGDGGASATRSAATAIPTSAPIEANTSIPTGGTTLAGTDTSEATKLEGAPAPSDAPVDAELESSSWVRSLDPTRSSVGGTRQPITVGIARRVEEAIAALATKPDPKIVTLQLDELDGVRLTVALRSDGVHLSSTGDARLTVDIERALASRGFDLSSEGRRQHDRQTPDESGGAHWRPQAAPRRRTTDPDAITL